MNKTTRMTLILGGLLAGGALSAQTTLLSEDFSGGTGDLNGTNSDANSITWNAASAFKANGDVNPNETDGTSGSALLDFTPQQGEIYDLTASFSVDFTGDSLGWIAFGFAQQDDSTGDFTEAPPVGLGWIRIREGETSGGDDGGFTVSAFGAQTTNFSSGGATDFRVRLDATAQDSSDWTVEGFFNGTSITGSAEKIASNGNLGNVSVAGLSRNGNSGVTGSFSSFELTEVPEPAHAALAAGVAVVIMAGVLRRRRG